MTRWDRVVWLASWLAPLGWIVAAAVLALETAAPAVRLDARTFAWTVAVCAILGAFGHLVVLHHGHTSGRFSPKARRELRRSLWTGRGYHKWRALMRHSPSWYKGRSHSGERPRFD